LRFIERAVLHHFEEDEGVRFSQARAVNSRLEGLVCLNRHRVRGLRNVSVHVALCIIAMLLVAVAALRLGMPEKARCIASFGWR